MLLVHGSHSEEQRSIVLHLGRTLESPRAPAGYPCPRRRPAAPESLRGTPRLDGFLDAPRMFLDCGQCPEALSWAVGSVEAGLCLPYCQSFPARAHTWPWQVSVGGSRLPLHRLSASGWFRAGSRQYHLPSPQGQMVLEAHWVWTVVWLLDLG